MFVVPIMRTLSLRRVLRYASEIKSKGLSAFCDNTDERVFRLLRTSLREGENKRSDGVSQEADGGGVGIRTLDGLVAHTHLAGEHLRPLGHSSA